MSAFLQHPVARFLVRPARVYLQGLVGFLVAGNAGMEGVAAADFIQILINASSLAVAPAVVSLIQNTIELLTKVDESKPEYRG